MSYFIQIMYNLYIEMLVDSVFLAHLSMKCSKLRASVIVLCPASIVNNHFLQMTSLLDLTLMLSRSRSF